MKHELERLGPDGFEKLIQALMTKLFGIQVKIYGDGPDRQREALIENAHYEICSGVEALGRTIVQAKFKSPDGSAKDWGWLRKQLKEELDGFAKTAKSDPEFIPETWLFFTNLILTPANGGLKDKVDAYIDSYRTLIPHIYVLGADEIRALLDAYPEVACRYAAFLTPSDVLADAYNYLQKLKLEPLRNLMEHVRQRFQADAPVRLEQAGSLDNRIDVRHVYTDMEAIERGGDERIIDGLAAAILRLGDRPHPRQAQNAGEERNVLPENNLVLIGSAGQGKSTLCQYICQIYRAALLEHYCPDVESAQGYSKEVGIIKPSCERFPLLIRLRDYAAWLGKRQEGENGSVLHYLVWLIQKDAGEAMPVSTLRALLKSYSWVFFFDGLDEVPASSNRAELLGQIKTFLSQDLAESNCDSIIICTTRPQGYDRAFSPFIFRHIELRDMSSNLCMRYINRLLRYLEPDNSLRESYHIVLKKSLDDPLVAKLMVTPLYTSILVLLVKSGSTPPTRRFELFEEYSNTVIKREKQRELLPCLYDGDDAWICELHGQIAYLLQSESETAENAAAELSVSRCRELIRRYVEEDGWEGNKEKKADELFWAMTNRLPFLAETTDADGESCVLFPLRSLQEYFAAKHLLRIEDAENRYDILQAISLSAYWRNVFLFIAGAFSACNSRSVISNIYEIARSNNGESGLERQNQTACRLAFPGSRLALDLLCDNLFERQHGQDRYLDLASKLLIWDYSDASPLENFLKLPSMLLQRFIREYAIPHLQMNKNPNEAAFALLWEAARNGNTEASHCLEEYADTLLQPTQNTVSFLIKRGVEGLGTTILIKALSWVTECYPWYYNLDSDAIIKLIICACGEGKQIALPNSVKRWATYQILRDRHRRYYFSPSKRLPDLDDFLHTVYRVIQRERENTGTNTFNLNSCFQKLQDAMDWASLKKTFEEQDFAELVALVDYLTEPSAETLGKITESIEHMPLGLRRAFLSVLREQNWLLREIAEALDTGISAGTFKRQYDEKIIQSYRERESAILQALQEGDNVALSEMNAWKSLVCSPLDPWDSTFPAFFNVLCDKPIRTWSIHDHHELLPKNARVAILSQFSICFNDWGRATFALLAFAQTPASTLATARLSYPSGLKRFSVGSLVRDSIRAILERLEALCNLGGPYLEAYALLPYIFGYAEKKDFCRLAESAVLRYGDVKATGNDCALLGVILLLLTGRIPLDLYSELGEETQRLLHQGIDVSDWHQFSRHFSIDGELLAHEAGMTAFKGTDKEISFIQCSRCAILQSLEALPADRDKLPDLVTLCKE